MGKGTDVEITVPVEKSNNVQPVNGTFNDPSDVTKNPQQCISNLQHRATGRSIRFSRREGTDLPRQKDISWSCIQKYCTEWFGFEIKETSADLIVTDREETSTKYNDGQRVLVVHDDMACATKQELVHTQYAISKICSPIGPFKLARSILALLDQEIIIPRKLPRMVKQTSVGTQTPLGSPEERTIMNGIILTDYGFTPSPLPTIPDASSTDEPKTTNITTALATWNNQQQSGADQAFASISTLSMQSPPHPSSTTHHPSPTFPFFPAPTMTLTLPNPKVMTPPPDSTTKASFHALHILAVDDNALNLQLLHRYLLKRGGDTIVTARNGIEAVEAVKALRDEKKRKGKDSFDVIFMDISMPEMDGFEATRVIRSYEQSAWAHLVEEMYGEGVWMEKEKRAYIVALTGLASRRDRDLAEECGFDDFFDEAD